MQVLAPSRAMVQNSCVVSGAGAVCYEAPAMDDLPERPVGTAALVASAVIFYLIMGLLGLGAMALQDLDLGAEIFGGGESLPRDTLYGAGAGLAVVLLTRLLWRWEPMRKLNEELRGILGSPGTGAIAILAVTSAVGEELLFRGAIQPLLGLWITSAVFGFAHGGSARRFRAWALFALAAGLLLGALEEVTQNLLAPILCHLTVNYFNLHHLVSTEEASA